MGVGGSKKQTLLMQRLSNLSHFGGAATLLKWHATKKATGNGCF